MSVRALPINIFRWNSTECKIIVPTSIVHTRSVVHSWIRTVWNWFAKEVADWLPTFFGVVDKEAIFRHSSFGVLQPVTVALLHSGL